MKHHIVAIVLLIAVSAAASSLIAMRVETEALAASDDETLMSVVVAIAPEDRARTGSTVWLAGELSRGSETVDRFDARVQVGRDGSARVEQAWPPGAYDLRIDIESSSSNATGFWKGRILVPRMAEAESPPPPPEAAATTAAPEPEPAPREPVEGAPSSAETSPEGESDAGSDPEPEPPTGIAAAMAAAAAASPPPSVAGGPPSQEREPEPEAPAPASPPPAEPSRVEAPPATPASTASMPAVTVIATDSRNNPVTTLRREDFELRVGGDETPVSAVDGAGSELLLGFAVDISSTMDNYLPETRRLLRRLAERSLGPGSSLFVVTGGAESQVALAAGASVPDLGDQLRQPASSAEGDLVGLIETSLAQFEGRAGRKIMVLISDGGDTATKAQWKEALESAASAGIPVLVVAFDGGDVVHRTSTRLRRVAETSGGKYYSLRSTDTLRLTFDHFADLIEASYALGFQTAKSGTQKLKVSTADRNVRILHSKAVAP